MSLAEEPREALHFLPFLVAHALTERRVAHGLGEEIEPDRGAGRRGARLPKELRKLFWETPTLRQRREPPLELVPLASLQGEQQQCEAICGRPLWCGPSSVLL
ncbi:MAG: hypothetical protein ACREB9_03670, partial [Thermoplasmata archaeon]